MSWIPEVLFIRHQRSHQMYPTAYKANQKEVLNLYLKMFPDLFGNQIHMTLNGIYLIIGLGENWNVRILIFLEIYTVCMSLYMHFPVCQISCHFP